MTNELIEKILAHHKAEFPFEESEENRDRYYWLSGFLRDFLRNSFSGDPRAYRATREIELEFPDPKYGNRYLTIPAGQTMTGEVQQDFLYMEIQGFGPARIPLALLEEAK